MPSREDIAKSRWRANSSCCLSRAFVTHCRERFWIYLRAVNKSSFEDIVIMYYYVLYVDWWQHAKNTPFHKSGSHPKSRANLQSPGLESNYL